MGQPLILCAYLVLATIIVVCVLFMAVNTDFVKIARVKYRIWPLNKVPRRKMEDLAALLESALLEYRQDHPTPDRTMSTEPETVASPQAPQAPRTPPSKPSPPGAAAQSERIAAAEAVASLGSFKRSRPKFARRKAK
jgi:hypothetical protein